MKRKENMPFLVYVGLLGLDSRGAALTFMWICTALGVFSLVLGFSHPKAFGGLLFFIAAAWYRYAVKWMDKNSTWDWK